MEKTMNTRTGNPRNKVLAIKEEKYPKIKCMETVMENVRPEESVQEWWEERITTTLSVGHEVLSIRAGRRSPGDRVPRMIRFRR